MENFVDNCGVHCTTVYRAEENRDTAEGLVPRKHHVRLNKTVH